MNFELTTDLTGLRTIDFNYDAIKSELDERLSVYGGPRAILDKETLKTAKDDRAKLNKLADALKESKLSVKRTVMKPYDAFAAKVDELIGMVTSVNVGIDDAVKGYENAEKDEKRAKIQQFFILTVGDLKDVLPFERLYNPRWLNATYKAADIEGEIALTINNLRNNMQVVRDLKTPYEQEIMSVLLDTLNLGDALARKARLERQAEALASVARPVPIPTPIPEPIPACIEQAPPAPVYDCSPAPVQDELQRIEFVVFVTPAQKQLMREFLKSNNIRYGFIQKETNSNA